MKKNLLFHSAVLLLVFCSVQKPFAQNSIGLLDKMLIANSPLSIPSTRDEIITGTVTDEKGEPLVGASIVLEGTTKGALADENGKYTLELTAADKKGKLIVSFVGYDKQVVAIDGRSVINIILQETGALDAVVVVGFATQKKATVTGAIASIGTKDLLQSPVANLSNSLAGPYGGSFCGAG